MINRELNFEILKEIKEHWSPRAFDPNHKIEEEDLLGILEAARFAPSCFNEQPWEYIVGNDKENWDKIYSVINPSNQRWAVNAPVLLIILSKQKFAHNNKNNPWNQFDAGTSWGYLSLEAQRRGIMNHAMGGFNADMAREIFQIPDDYSVIATVALGYLGDKESLVQDDLVREFPSPRKSIQELIYNPNK